MVHSACKQTASKGLSETESKLPLVIPVTASGCHDPTKQPATHLCRIEWPPSGTLASALAGLQGLGPAMPAAPPGCSDSPSVDSSVYALHCHRASF